MSTILFFFLSLFILNKKDFIDVRCGKMGWAGVMGQNGSYFVLVEVGQAITFYPDFFS